MTEKPIEYLNHLDDVVYSLFDDDPDGEEGRAGDGWYFQVAGDDDWNGAWQSETEAMEEAKDALSHREWTAIEAEMTEAEFKAGHDEETDFFEKTDGDTTYRISIDEDTVLVETAPGSKNTVLISYDVDKEGTGHTHYAVREAKHVIQSIIEVAAMPGVVDVSTRP